MIPTPPLMDFLETRVFPVALPREVTKIIATYFCTHVNKAFIADELARWRKKHVVVVHKIVIDDR